MAAFRNSLVSGVILLVYCNAALCQMQQMPTATFSSEDGSSTYAVYNGKVFKIPKKEEPSTGWFNFDLLDNALVRTLLGWSDYFTGVSGQPDMYEEANLAGSQSQSAAQYAMPNYNGLNFNDNNNKYPLPPPPPPMRGQGQGYQGNYYPRPPSPPQWSPQKPQQNYGNPGFKSQYPPPRPAPVFQQMPPMPPQPQMPPMPFKQQIPMQQPAPGFFPQEPLNSPNNAPYSVQVSNNFEGGQPKYNIPSVEIVTHVLGEGELEGLANNENSQNPEFERVFESGGKGGTFGPSSGVDERSDVDASVGIAPETAEDTLRRTNPCPKIGRWNYKGELCVAVGNFPRWACKPSDLVGNRDVVVCRKKVWLTDESQV